MRWNLFFITVSLWVDSTGHKWFPSKSVIFADLWCLLCCESEQAVVKESSVRWFETPRCSYDSSAMGLPILLNIWTMRPKQQFWAKVLIHYNLINTKPLEHLDIFFTWVVNYIQVFIRGTDYCSTLMNRNHYFKIENICSKHKRWLLRGAQLTLPSYGIMTCIVRFHFDINIANLSLYRQTLT